MAQVSAIKTNIEEMQMVGIEVMKPGDIESTTMSKVTWRLVPFLMLCYFIAYLDRVNIGFAGATLRADLDLSATAFGGAAGIFFLAYFFFEVPSNLAFECLWCPPLDRPDHVHLGDHFRRPGIRLGRPQFQHCPPAARRRRSRFLPRHHFLPDALVSDRLSRPIVGWFMFAIPISTVIGAPISGLILGLEGVAGLHGWQSMFLIEGFPALIMTFAVLLLPH